MEQEYDDDDDDYDDIPRLKIGDADVNLDDLDVHNVNDSIKLNQTLY